jgi:phenylacetate-CoA ligase
VIVEHQRQALQQLLRQLSSNAFYSSRPEVAQLAAELPDLQAFSRSMPFTLKAELAADQAAHPPCGSNLTFDGEQYTRLHQTSSTTGAPLCWLDTAEDWSWLLDGWQEVLRGAEVTEHDKLLFAFSFGPFLGFWAGFDAAARMGCLTLPGGALTSVGRLQLLLRHQVSVVCCTPTYALRLGEVAQQEGIDLRQAAVRALIVAGEAGGCIPATRRRIEELWPGARVHDHYGMTEVGPVTFQCNARDDSVHVNEEHYFCEILDPQTQEPCEGSDQLGELVLTTLGRVGSPVLRYRTGDLVKALPREPCECGRSSLRLQGGILSRADDMVVIRGVNLYPGAVDQVVRGFPDVTEYQALIDRNDGHSELSLQLESSLQSAGSALAEKVAQAFRDRYNLRIEVTPVKAGALPRFELKARRWIRRDRSAPTS